VGSLMVSLLEDKLLAISPSVLLITFSLQVIAGHQHWAQIHSQLAQKLSCNYVTPCQCIFFTDYIGFLLFFPIFLVSWVFVTNLTLRSMMTNL
jgi:hypothetical protein